MESRLKLLGHPIHPMLIVVPLGLFSIAVLFDAAYLATGNADLAVGDARQARRDAAERALR